MSDCEALSGFRVKVTIGKSDTRERSRSSAMIPGFSGLSRYVCQDSRKVARSCSTSARNLESRSISSACDEDRSLLVGLLRSGMVFPSQIGLGLGQRSATAGTHVRWWLARVLALVEDRAVDARPVSALRDLPHLVPDRRSTPRRDSRGVGCEARPLEIAGARAIPPSRIANLCERPLGADAIRSLLHALELPSVRGSACLHVRVPTSPGFVLSQITKRDRALACRSAARLSERCW